jgi:uracil-DNA glycosylase
MIVGEAPGRDEIRQGEPFIGSCGVLLDNALQRHGLSRQSIYITNAFKGDVGPGNPRPTRAQLDDHFPILMSEIECVRPTIILTLGQRAACVLLPDVLRTLRSALGPYVGELRRSPTAGIQVLPWYHPGYVLRGGAPREAFDSTVGHFVTYLATGDQQNQTI